MREPNRQQDRAHRLMALARPLAHVGGQKEKGGAWPPSRRADALGVIRMQRPGQAASPMEYWTARGW